MALFKVLEIIDGDTIKVSPKWIFEGQEGDIVKIFGYTTPPEILQANATLKLRNLLLNKSVELKDARKFTPESAALLCMVFLNGVSVAKYFPEFQIRN
jgi:endonuclease YncB( thermonuclease family)